MTDGVLVEGGTAFEQRTCHRLQQFTMITRGTEERPAIVALVMTQRILSSLLSEGDKL